MFTNKSENSKLFCFSMFVANSQIDICFIIPILILLTENKIINFLQNSKKRQEYGEQIYNLVCKYHKPELASRLTGMLLELDEESLQTLLTNHKEFEKKLEIAYNTFISYCSS